MELSDKRKLLLSTNVLLAIGLKSAEDLTRAEDIFRERLSRDPALQRRQCQFALDCSRELPSFVGPYISLKARPAARLAPWTEETSGRRLHEEMTRLSSKWESEEFVLAIMLFLNQFSGSKIAWVQHSIDATWEKGPLRSAKEISAMFLKCGGSFRRCIQDENCSKAIGELEAMNTRGQASSYRAMVSYESKASSEFSFCSMQLNNIFGCDASIPSMPSVEPIATFRGKPLTHEIARGILVGHLDETTALAGGRKSRTSWKVACGANEAYSAFRFKPCSFTPPLETTCGTILFSW